MSVEPIRKDKAAVKSKVELKAVTSLKPCESICTSIIDARNTFLLFFILNAEFSGAEDIAPREAAFHDVLNSAVFDSHEVS